jgi:serine/threonine-protein kinase
MHLAHVSNESGGNEIYVRPFPAGENKWRVSSNGGTGPRWRRDGRELIYIEGDQLMAVSVTTQPTLSPGTPAALFSRRYLTDLTLHPQYDVTSDGKRFLVRERRAEKPLAVHVAHNWFEEFRGQQ